MSQYKIYGIPMGSSLRPIWLAEELGLNYEIVPVDLRSGDQKKPEFLAINPNGQVPVLVCEDGNIFESMAICRYFAEVSGKFGGKNAFEKAQIDQWSQWVINKVQDHLGKIAGQKWRGENDEVVIETAKENLKKPLEILDEYLADKSFLVGEEFTIADINVAVALFYADFFDENFYVEYLNVDKYLKNLKTRPAYKAVTTKE